jgi:hypothetical protein
LRGSDPVNYTTNGSDPTKCEGGGGGGGGWSRSRSRSRSRSGGGGAYKAPVLSVTVRNRSVNRYRILTEGIAGTFTAVIAVRITSTKEARHDYIYRLYTRPSYIIYIPRSVNLTSKLAKLSLYIRRPGRVSNMAGPQDRQAAGGEEGEGGHSTG